MVFTYVSLEKTRGAAGLGNQADTTALSAPRGTFAGPPKLFGSVSYKFYSCTVPTKKEKQPLSITHPELAKEAVGWDSSSITQASHKKLLWKCSQGHIFQIQVQKRTQRGNGCQICSGRKVLKGFNDIATTNPEIAKEADGWDPATVTAGSGKKIDWKCKIGHKYKATISNRISLKSGCPYCSNTKVLKGFNDLATTNPEIAKEADGWDPANVIAGSHKKYSWICSQGHRYTAVVGARTRSDRGTNCPVCANQKVLTGYNDFATLFPNLAQEAYLWDPSDFLPGSGEKKAWKCTEGHIYQSSIEKRTRSVKPTGCPNCAKFGFDQNKEAYIYFLEHPDWEMYQIGITNDLDRRLSEHLRNKWKVLEHRGPMDGLLTQQWETAILRMLKAKGADLSNIKKAGKFDGYSEAWSKSTFEANSIKELMKLTEEFEEGQRS